jgi:hypothetical protein
MSIGTASLSQSSQPLLPRISGNEISQKLSNCCKKTKDVWSECIRNPWVTIVSSMVGVGCTLLGALTLGYKGDWAYNPDNPNEPGPETNTTGIVVAALVLFTGVMCCCRGFSLKILYTPPLTTIPSNLTA